MRSLESAAIVSACSVLSPARTVVLRVLLVARTPPSRVGTQMLIYWGSLRQKYNLGPGVSGTREKPSRTGMLYIHTGLSRRQRQHKADEITKFNKFAGSDRRGSSPPPAMELQTNMACDLRSISALPPRPRCAEMPRPIPPLSSLPMCSDRLLGGLAVLLDQF